MRQSSPLVYQKEAEIRHGVHYIPREKEPSMFQILSWKEKPDAAADNQWLVKLKEGNHEGRFTQPKKYEIIEQPHNSREELRHLQDEHHLRPHPIKHELYYYGEEQAKTKKQQKGKKSPPKQKQKQKREIKRLDQFNEQDKRQIDIRKQNIQKFDAFTRDLPDSAFTTYFGKPAFGHYGFGAAGKTLSMSNLKSHSVMPHAGKNQPEQVQSHEGALSKANVINLESHVPRMPIESAPNQCKVSIKEYYNVQIVKPDLVNQARFSTYETGNTFKPKTPRHNQLNYLPKREYAKSPRIEPQKAKPKRKERHSEEKPDGLAFMNRRENFMREVKDKQKSQARLAYKVTQCYPYNWQNETEAVSTARQQKWKQIRPAGISSSRSLNYELRSH